jgi:hypothetical protein
MRPMPVIMPPAGTSSLPAVCGWPRGQQRGATYALRLLWEWCCWWARARGAHHTRACARHPERAKCHPERARTHAHAHTHTHTRTHTHAHAHTRTHHHKQRAHQAAHAPYRPWPASGDSSRKGEPSSSSCRGLCVAWARSRQVNVVCEASRCACTRAQITHPSTRTRTRGRTHACTHSRRAQRREQDQPHGAPLHTPGRCAVAPAACRARCGAPLLWRPPPGAPATRRWLMQPARPAGHARAAVKACARGARLAAAAGRAASATALHALCGQHGPCAWHPQHSRHAHTLAASGLAPAHAHAHTSEHARTFSSCSFMCSISAAMRLELCVKLSDSVSSSRGSTALRASAVCSGLSVAAARVPPAAPLSWHGGARAAAACGGAAADAARRLSKDPWAARRRILQQEVRALRTQRQTHAQPLTIRWVCGHAQSPLCDECAVLKRST